MSQMPTITDLGERRKRRAEAIVLHEIEGMTFTVDELTFMEELDRRGLTDEQRIEAIKARFLETETIAAE